MVPPWPPPPLGLWPWHEMPFGADFSKMGALKKFFKHPTNFVEAQKGLACVSTPTSNFLARTHQLDSRSPEKNESPKIFQRSFHGQPIFFYQKIRLGAQTVFRTPMEWLLDVRRKLERPYPNPNPNPKLCPRKCFCNNFAKMIQKFGSQQQISTRKSMVMVGAAIPPPPPYKRFWRHGPLRPPHQPWQLSP